MPPVSSPGGNETAFQFVGADFFIDLSVMNCCLYRKCILTLDPQSTCNSTVNLLMLTVSSIADALLKVHFKYRFSCRRYFREVPVSSSMEIFFASIVNSITVQQILILLRWWLQLRLTSAQLQFGLNSTVV